jgi:hypothetical protein
MDGDTPPPRSKLPKQKKIPMKTLPAFVVALLALAPTMSGLAQTVEKQACNVTVDITDTIRRAPMSGLRRAGR